MSELTLSLDEAALAALAAAIAARVSERLPRSAAHHEGYLAPAAAGQYLGVTRKRVYDLTSMGALVPDGRDGRTPLFTRDTLDAYVKCDSFRPT